MFCRKEVVLMKRKIQKAISVILAAAIMLTGSVFAFASDGEAADNSGIIAVTNIVNGLLNAVFKGFGALFPKDFETVEEYYSKENNGFYEGMKVFLPVP